MLTFCVYLYSSVTHRTFFRPPAPSGRRLFLRGVWGVFEMLLAPLLLLLLLLRASSAPIIISDALRARVFSGVGGISGGGATSRLIEDYPAPARASIYDALFTQQGAAAFQAVKVEIPADADTTCGSEVAHRHDAADGGSCTRGYEGAFLAEANSRLPGIAAHALQWAAPGFVGEAGVGNGTSPFTATNVPLRSLPARVNVTSSPTCSSQSTAPSAVFSSSSSESSAASSLSPAQSSISTASSKAAPLSRRTLMPRLLLCSAPGSQDWPRRMERPRPNERASAQPIAASVRLPAGPRSREV